MNMVANAIIQQAHALTPLLTTPEIQFPFLALLISGGHTLLLLARSKTSFYTLATTVDESIGNVFDKVAHILSIPWEGLGPGAALERFCSTHTDEPLPEIHPPLPQASRSKLTFSFTGLHSSVERFVTARDGTLDHPTKLALARAFQTAAIGHLEEKVLLGLIWCRQKGVDVRHVVVSGGVASNQFLRHRSVRFICQTSTWFFIKNFAGWMNAFAASIAIIPYSWSSPHLPFAQVRDAYGS
jgi:N6-L-threonylcarbamoyladenine synthase